jgi:ABC-type transporter Mla subunit MlaD
MLDLPFYLYPIIGYLIVYGVVYLGPLIWRIATNSMGSDTEELKRRINLEVEKEKERQTRDAHGNAVAADSSLEDNDASTGDDDSSDDSATPTWAVVGDSSAEEDEPEGGEEKTPAGETEEKPESEEQFLSRTLETSYKSTLVQQAVRQLRTKYPHGDFRQFEIERLPAYASYDERLTAARNMAGLFVLFGLLGTMIKLNEIVQKIGAAAGEQEMAATQFLDNMGLIMGDIGGAFDSSIYGLAIMVVALVAIGLGDRLMQSRLDTLDRAIQGTLIPGLSRLQLMKAPNLSIGDLIDETSSLLTDLNHSVEGLSEGMNDSLSDLSDEINAMMQDFGSFQKQYAQLNDLMKSLKEYTQNVEDVTDAIEAAGHELANPIDQMNRDLNHAIREHMGMVGDAISASEANRDELAREFQQLERDLKRLTGQLRDIARDTLEQVETNQEQLEGTLQAQQKRNQAAIENEIERLEAQSKTIQEELRATAEALEAANSQELTEVLDALEERLADSSGELAQSAGKLTGSAEEIADSADQLRRVTRGLQKQEKGPLTLFDWMRRTVEDARNGSR